MCDYRPKRPFVTRCPLRLAPTHYGMCAKGFHNLARQVIKQCFGELTCLYYGLAWLFARCYVLAFIPGYSKQYQFQKINSI
ncbi:hypothetical protein GDO86_000049 [Hymenochirus boettgeri]|uniref:Uncharacterized protein n=1 Tax=Hymenochirus boettgeri TaxID=247094 RepID=A0A8T2K9I5_9PIPI|nr:hypothetical protein GDO86_000049 [Hymenochirus boettgeri]